MHITHTHAHAQTHARAHAQTHARTRTHTHTRTSIHRCLLQKYINVGEQTTRKPGDNSSSDVRSKKLVKVQRTGLVPLAKTSFNIPNGLFNKMYPRCEKIKLSAKRGKYVQLLVLASVSVSPLCSCQERQEPQQVKVTLAT